MVILVDLQYVYYLKIRLSNVGFLFMSDDQLPRESYMLLHMQELINFDAPCERIPICK